jgi:excinuclease ABC subunit B
VAEQAAEYASMDAEQASATIKRLEAEMRKHAENLEFEEAAQLRDRIHQLRAQALR